MQGLEGTRRRQGTVMTMFCYSLVFFACLQNVGPGVSADLTSPFNQPECSRRAPRCLAQTKPCSSPKKPICFFKDWPVNFRTNISGSASPWTPRLCRSFLGKGE